MGILVDYINMKQTIFFLLLPALLLLSCSEDDGLDPGTQPSGEQIRFEMGFAGEADANNMTKVFTNPFYLTSSWQNGDKIGVYIVKSGGALQASGNYANNVEFTYNGGTWTPATPQYYPNDGDNLSFYAYYPYDAGMTNPNAYTFNVPTDQAYNNGEYYMKNDFLWAKQENIIKSDNAVALQFSHALAMIEIAIIDNVGPPPIVNLLEVVTDCKINLGIQNITPGSTKSTIQMWRRLTDNTTYFRNALVPPQTMDIRFVWTKNNIAYTVTPATNVTLTSGNVKRYSTNQP